MININSTDDIDIDILFYFILLSPIVNKNFLSAKMTDKIVLTIFFLLGASIVALFTMKPPEKNLQK